MHTTVLGDCDLCQKRDVDVVLIAILPEEIFACEECLGIEPRKVASFNQRKERAA